MTGVSLFQVSSDVKDAVGVDRRFLKRQKNQDGPGNCEVFRKVLGRECCNLSKAVVVGWEMMYTDK
jgi:hypothetical protein